MGQRDRPRIGLFIEGGTYAYQEEIVYGAHEESQRRGLDLICFAGGGLGGPDARSYCYDIASPSDLDGAILVPGTWSAPLDSAPVQALVARYSGLPCCLIGARIGDLPSVCVDNATGVEELTRHLIEVHGRTRIAFIEGRGLEAEERKRGYERALIAGGLRPDAALTFPGDYTLMAGRAAATHFCQGGVPLCDAIVAANDWMASGALEVLREQGVRVPDDIALVGFDDIERASFMSPPLTTIRQPPHFLGAEAVSMIARLFAGEVAERHVAVPTFARVRRSCGCFAHSTSPPSLISYRGSEPPSLPVLRPRIAGRLLNVAGDLAYGLSEDWAERLVDALVQDLDAGGGKRFVDYLVGLISATSERGNITAWHHVVSQLREHSLVALSGDLSRLLTAETLFGRAYIAVGEQAELAQGQRLLEREDVILRLEEASHEARTALDWKALCAVLSRQLPRLGIGRCQIATGNGGADGESRQVFAFESGRELELPVTGLAFRTSELMAAPLRPAVRTTLMVQPLFVHDEVLGHYCMEVGPKNSTIFKTLADLISSALKATRMNQALIEEVTRRERAERARMLQELEIAAHIQTAILPREPAVRGLELATVMRPATEVGGDYFDILPCPNGCWIGIGDVAGHGLTAGMIMLMIQSIVAATVHDRPDIGPAQAWRALNAVLSTNIRERMRHDDHATLSLIRYRETGHCVVAGSHEDLIIFRAASGRCERLPTPGIWAGIFPDVPEAEIREVECDLRPGDVLLLYTDGILEARSRDGEEYGIDRLEQVFSDNARRPVQVICDTLMRDVTRWMARQHDDVTLVVARHIGTPAE